MLDFNYYGSPDYFYRKDVAQSDKIWGKKENKDPRIRTIPGQLFYSLVTNNPDAMIELYAVLPQAIDDYLSSLSIGLKTRNTIKEDIKMLVRGFEDWDKKLLKEFFESTHDINHSKAHQLPLFDTGIESDS